MHKQLVIMLLSVLSVGLSGYELDKNLKCPGHIRNSAECAQYLENKLLPRLNFVKREEGTLLIKTGVGKTVKFVNNDYGDVSGYYYYLVGYIEDIRMLIIYCQYWEDGGLIAVHQPNGTNAVLFNYPEISPDRRQFVTASIAVDAGGLYGAISIYNITSKGYRLSGEFKSNQWQVKDIAWENNSTIRCGKIVKIPGYDDYKLVDTKLIKSKKGWVEKKSKRQN